MISAPTFRAVASAAPCAPRLHPPLWRGAAMRERIEGPDALGRYRFSVWSENRCCRLEQYGPTRVCVMGDHGFLVQVDVEGDVR